VTIGKVLINITDKTYVKPLSKTYMIQSILILLSILIFDLTSERLKNGFFTKMFYAVFKEDLLHTGIGSCLRRVYFVHFG
jgi:hypothetical protein